MDSGNLHAEPGRRLHEVRHKAGLSLRAIGDMIGLKAPSSRSYLSRLEAGKVGVVKLLTVVRYLQACNEPAGRFSLALAQDGISGRCPALTSGYLRLTSPR